VLASSSPRRAELLRSAGLDFEIVTAPVDEEAITADLAAAARGSSPGGGPIGPRSCDVRASLNASSMMRVHDRVPSCPVKPFQDIGWGACRRCSEPWSASR